MIRGWGRGQRIILALGVGVGLAATAACFGTDPALYDRADGGDRSDGGLDGPEGGASTGADASPSADGGTYCSGILDASYCEDFDTMNDVAVLDRESSAPELVPALTRETSRSAPRSLAMGIPENYPEGSYLVYKRAFGGTLTVRVELDWNFSIAPEVPGTLQAITLKRLGPQVSFGRACAPDGDGGVGCKWYVARCVTNGCELLDFPSPPFVGKWARIFLEARLEKAGHLAFGVVGEPPIFDADIVGATDDVAPEDATVLTVGLANLQGASPGLGMFVDSVVVYER